VNSPKLASFLAVLDTSQLAARKFMCAWHDALAELLAYEEEAGSNKTLTVTGRKGNANRARALPETGCLEEA
jgi:hypothetical protein